MCCDFDLVTVAAVEAVKPPPSELVPVGIVGSNVPLPIGSQTILEDFAPTSVVEDVLAPLPAPPRPGSVAAMNEPPLVNDSAPVSHLGMGDGSSSAAPAVQVASATSPTSTFIAKVTKQVGVVLPCPPPPPPKPRKKTLPEDFIPRRSRRVAKLPPVSDHKSAATVCRQLTIH